jgi:intracellular multiplication protein IcmP
MSKDNNSNQSALPWVAAALGLLTLLVWLTAAPLISYVLMGARAAQMWVIGMITFPLRAIPDLAWVSVDAVDIAKEIVALDPNRVTLVGLRAVMDQTGEWIRWVYVLVFGALFVAVVKRNPLTGMRKSYDMESLAAQEVKVWPHLAPILGKNLVKGDIRTGEFAAAMTEREFAEKHKLIVDATSGAEDGSAEDGSAEDEEANDARQVLDIERTRAVFVAQLGPLWKGHRALPLYAKAVFAALALRVDDQKDVYENDKAVAERLKTSEEMLGEFSRIYAAGGRAAVEAHVAPWVDAALDEHMKHPRMQRLVAQHAYVFTVFATLLQLARVKGVLSTSQVLWLKVVDRRLFYTLNNSSPNATAFHVECAGIMAHWLAEKSFQERLIKPYVDNAVRGLEKALSEYSEDDTEERIFR